MTALSSKQWRDRLFKKSRPLVRKHETSDNGFLWAAYQRGAFDLPKGLTQADFLIEMAKKFGAFNLLWVIEDDSEQFKAKRGLVALVGINTDGWQYVPKVFCFPWATPKNVLRSYVGFLQMIRYQKDVGVCRFESLTDDLNRLKKYGVLYPRGRVPSGSPAGDLFIYSISGKK